ncbi:putative MATE family efflux protein [Lachnospiraceae bacterium PM6-15]|uniref:MATE family efflux transporter n=1 Tax=Ohessyouella blattaphilus TaxID=2949333 RepID=A0ABT1EHU1_9FIRM|nr:MATE family efflux transporter [Ohessyouella blattaphilus]MCP1110044.1 MATE family efflux transporter [Ohessyouella blattaphilus]MCR8563438.1 MATE family efflux transporter [Ohessyouella blattaphilus]
MLLKRFLKYTSLNVIGMIGVSCYILADTFFIAAGLGADGLAALNLAIPVYGLINSTALMIAIGAGTAFAVERAKRNQQKSNEIFTCGVLLALLFAAIYILAGLFFSEKIALLLGANQDILALTTTYLKTMLFFSPAFLMNQLLIAFIRNDKNPGLSMAGMLIGSFSNIILDYVFIFPLKMGMFGAAFATGLAPLISMAVMSQHFFKKQNTFQLLKTGRVLKRGLFVLLLGVSSFVTEIASSIVIVVFNFLILGLAGNTGVAAYGIIANLSLVVTSIFTGIAQGVQPLISSAYGKKEISDIKKSAAYALFMAFILALVSVFFVAVFREGIIALFNSEGNQKLASIASRGILLYFTAFPFAGINIVAVSIFNSVTKARAAFLLSLLRGMLVIIPLSFLLAGAFGLTGVWLAFPVTEVLTVLIAAALLLGILRGKIRY